MMKAFAIQEDCEGTGGIYFAEHAIAAKKAFANEHNDGELNGLTCHRAPWADEYTGKVLPASIMVAHGWWFDCAHCGERIDEDRFADEDRLVDDIIGTQASLVFCDRTCKAQYEAQKAAAHAIEEEAIMQLRALVRKRFPSVTFTAGDTFKEHAYACWHDGRPKLKQAFVSFEFPGMKIGPASFGIHDAADSWLVIPEYRCCAGDKEAFEAFAAIPRPTSTGRDD